MFHDAFAAQPRFTRVIRRVLTSTAAETGVIEMPVPPTGSIYLNALVAGQIQISFSDGKRVEAPKLYFGGQILRDTPIARIRTPLLIVGLQFEATGFYRLFGVEASKLTGRMTPLESIDPSVFRQLTRELRDLDRSDTIADVMQASLEDRLKSTPESTLAERAADAIEACGGRIDVADLAARFAVSERHLRRAFAVEVGASPKTYAKTVQLNEVIAALQSNAHEAMRDIALSHGYYDQAHFVRDFSRLVGSNPTEFMASRDPFLGMFLGRRAPD